MAAAHSLIDWSRCPELESKPDTQGGAWVFRGTRAPVTAILRNLGEMSLPELQEEFPTVRREQIEGLLAFLAQSVESPVLAELIAQITPENRYREIETGNEIGNEAVKW